MSNFTVFDVGFPADTKQRVIINTDAKNEADDQYAIVHAVLTPSFDLHGSSRPILARANRPRVCRTATMRP